MTATTRAPEQPRTVSANDSWLAGTWTMIRFILRRDRVRLPVWVAAHGLMVLYVGSALPQLAPDEDELAGLTSLLSQPVGRMFTGPAYGMDAPTYEIFFAAGYAPYLFVLATLMNIMVVTRHTRAEEQSGRAELVRSSVTGRHTALTATLVVAGLATLAAGAVVTALAVALGYPTTGSVLIGLATTATGLVFAGVTAMMVQVSEFSRTAAGMAGAVLGAAFLLRALGDMVAVGGSALSWVSPLGWAAQTAPYVHDRWTPLLLSVALAALTVAIAFALQRRRDFGASLAPPRPGAARAHPSLGHPVGLAARLQRGGLLGWGVAILTLGVVNGLFAQAMIDSEDAMPDQLGAVFGSDQLLQGYAAFLGSFMSIFAAAYVVQAMQTLRTEEDTGRADGVLATPVSRSGFVAAHTIVIAAGAILIMGVTGLCTGIAAAGVTGDTGMVGDILMSHLTALPAVLVVLGLCAALFGVLPKLMAPVGWMLVLMIGVVDLFGELLDLPQWLRMLSPLWHLADMPVEDFAAAPFLALLGGALFAWTVGLVRFHHREINVA